MTQNTETPEAPQSQTFELFPTDGAIILRGNGSIELANPGGNNPAIAVAINIVGGILGVNQNAGPQQED